MVLLVKEGPPPTSRGAAEKLVCGPLCSQVLALESQREAIWGVCFVFKPSSHR